MTTVSFADVRPLVQIRDWLPGESLYGWSTRHDAIYGRSETQTGVELFRRDYAAQLLDLPVGLDHFVAKTRGLLGGPVEILRQRTVVGWFWPFLNDALTDEVQTVARASDGPPLVMALGLCGQRTSSPLRLRHCPQCIVQGLVDTGGFIRALRHQLPSSWYCYEHDRPLQSLKVKNQWVLPRDSDVLDQLPQARSERQRRALEMCAKLGELLLELDRIDMQGLILSCFHRLHVLGVSTQQRINSARADEWFDCSAIGQWLRLDEKLPQPPKGWINNLLRRSHKPQPLKWILLWAALWERNSVDEALTGFRQASAGLDAYQHHWLAHFEPFSTFEAPLNLVPIPSEVREAFECCHSIEEVSRMVGITQSAARQHLFDNPELAGTWTSKLNYRRTVDAKARLDGYLRRNPTARLEQVLRAEPKDVAWLRAHSIATWRQVVGQVERDLPAKEGMLY